MKQVIEEILNGKLNLENGYLDFSCPRIDLSVFPNQIIEDSFLIYGQEGVVTEGTVVSDHLRMTTATNRFYGSKDEILYRFDATGMEAGEECRGNFQIISNQGEFLLPFCITVEAEVISSSLGSIKNLFHFTNLAKSNWEEAVKLFYSTEFETVFTGNDRKYYAVYKGLSEVDGNEHNVEEFLLKINKKKPVEFLPEESQIKIEDPVKNSRYTFVINRNGWGYTHLEIFTEGGFLHTEERVATDVAFLGNIYRIYYYIDLDALHAGNNMGAIVLRQDEREIRIPVTVVQHIANQKELSKRAKSRETVVALMDAYQDFRLKKISTKNWMAETNDVLQKMLEMNDKSMVANLFKAQLLLTEERYNEARWIIEQKEDEVLARQSREPELWCYYLYLTTLYSKDEKYVDEVAAVVEEVYGRNRGNWRIAWLLLYLSAEYVKSPAKKWMLLEEVISFGCTSPVIYIEGWHILVQNPAMLMKLEETELQILQYAGKKGLFTDEIIMQIAYLCEKEKGYSDRLYKILNQCYEKKQTDDVLQAICKLLINGNCREKKFFKWYREGVSRNLRITRLYEYFMMSMPMKERVEIPKIVLMYFAYQSNLQYEQAAYLYAYVHRHKGEYPDIYQSYHETIEKFILTQISRSRINEDLAYLYKNCISAPMINEESAGQLLPLIFERRIRFTSKRMKEVILVYPYCKETICYPVTGSEVCVPVYDSECEILIGDGRGNRYSASVDFEIEGYANMTGLLMMIAPYVREKLGFAIYMCYEYQNIFAVHEENTDLFARLAESVQIKDSNRKEIRKKLIDFYFSQDKMRELDDMLLQVRPEDILERDRKEIVRYMVLRGMYEEAYSWVKNHGYHDIDAKVLMKLTSRILTMQNEQDAEDEMLPTLLFDILQKGKYDENILQYLMERYFGNIRNLREIWKAAQSYGMDVYELCERMLVQMMYTGAFIGEKNEIFRFYCKNGGKEDIITAFLAQCCYDYLVNQKLIEGYIFECIRKFYDDGIEYPLVCKAAFLQYYAENSDERTDEIKELCKEFLGDLLAEHKVFPFYKDYEGFIPQMAEYQDKTILEYRAKPGSCAVIHYLIEGEDRGQEGYRKEEMKDMFEGICVKEFVLFFGERMQYYITEFVDGKEELTQSGTVNKSDIGQDSGESRFAILNDIMIGKTLQDYGTVDALLHEYYKKSYMVSRLFVPQ